MRKSLLKLSALALLLLPAVASAQDSETPPEQKQIQLTFEGTGETTSLESVLVENLTNGEHVKLTGNEILILGGEGSGVEEIKGGLGDFKPLLYPNPAQGDGNLVFDAPNDGNATVSIYAMNGTLVDRATVPVMAGRNALNIPSQGYGFFMVYLDGEGYNHVTKWMCGAEKTGSVISHIGTSCVALPREVIKSTRAATPESKGLAFTPGDVLRLTATSGVMKTIVMRKPEVDHTVTFQMYKCQDADGYNYPIIEAGGLLWMAEDLHPVTKAGLSIAKDQEAWSDPKADELRMAYADFDESNTNVGAYFTPRAAVKALPEGWKLPTANELLEVVKAYGGAEKAGGILKGHGYESGWNTADYDIDEVQLSLNSNGLLQADGQFKSRGNAAFIVTRSFKDGLAHAMKLKDADNSAVLDHATVCGVGEGFTVRGVRVAQSPYNAIINNWLAENPEIAPKHYSRQDLLKGGLQGGNPFADHAPLGMRYDLTSGAEEFICDTKVKRVSGYDQYTSYAGSEVDLGAIANPEDKLYKLVPINMPDGVQKLIRLTWSNAPRSGFGLAAEESLMGEGTIKLELFDNKKNDYKLLKTVTVDPKYKFNMLAIKDMEKVFKKNIYKDWGSYVQFDFRNLESIPLWGMLKFSEAIQSQCADFNGDGQEDIMILVGRSMVILDGTDFETPLFEHEFTQATKECGSIFCSVGDINRDGQPDLAMSFEKAGSIYVEVWWDGYKNFGKSSSFQRILGKAANCHSVFFGDINDDNKLDLVTYIYNNNYELDEYAPMKITLSTYNRELNTLEEYASVSHIVNNNDWLLKTGNSEMVMVRSKGMGETADLIVNGHVFRWLNNELKFKYQLTAKWNEAMINGCLAAGNFDGNETGKEQLIMFYRTCSATDVSSNQTIKRDLRVGGYLMLYFLEDKEAKAANIRSDDFYNERRGYDALKNDKFAYHFYSICPLRSEAPLRTIELTSIETTMSEPRIYALLAAPPYWEGVDYKSEPGTSWGYNKSSGTGTSNATSHAATMIAGYEQDFNLPLIGTKVGGIDFELQIKNTWEESHESSTMTEYGQDYTTFWDDAVVLTMTPFTAYMYTVVQSGNIDEIGSQLMIGAPDKPRTMMLNLNDYMAMRADNPAIPNLQALFKHKPGNPWSYEREFAESIKSVGTVLWGNGSSIDMQNVGSGGTAARSIAITQEQVSSKENEFALDATLVMNVMGVKLGGGYGYTNKNGISHTESVGHTVVGSVMAPRRINDPAAKNFSWNICRKNVEFEGQKFPVVTYVVER